MSTEEIKEIMLILSLEFFKKVSPSFEKYIDIKKIVSDIDYDVLKEYIIELRNSLKSNSEGLDFLNNLPHFHELFPPFENAENLFEDIDELEKMDNYYWRELDLFNIKIESDESNSESE